MTTCIGSLLKGFLFAVNVLVLAAGLAVVGLGASALAGVLPFVRDWNLYVVIGFMVAGGLSAVLAALCLYGIAGRSKISIWIYVIVVSVIIAGEIAIAVILIKFRPTFDAAASLIWSLLGSTIQSFIGTSLSCTDYTSCASAAVAVLEKETTIVYAVLFALLGMEGMAVVAAMVTLSEMRRGKSLYELYQAQHPTRVAPQQQQMQAQQEAPKPSPAAHEGRVVIEETRRYVV